MALPICTEPPPSRTSYIISQLDGEQVSIPGSKGVFRILASSKQTNGKISVFQSGAVLSDAPGFHYHNEAHDVFIVTKGFLKLWNGDRCRIMGPGDFAYVPPVSADSTWTKVERCSILKIVQKVIHNPEMMGPHTESFGLVAPGDWIDFFRYIGEAYEGIVVPEDDTRDLKSHVIPKVMSATKDYDVNFVRDYDPPEVGEWQAKDSVLPDGMEPYFLRANTGPRWMADGVMSRPFINVKQSGGRFAISSIESSSKYPETFLSGIMAFPNVDHCMSIQEGVLKVKLEGQDDWTLVREGETVMIAASQPFSLQFGSKYVRAWSFTNGPGIEQVIQDAGEPCESVVITDQCGTVEMAKVEAAFKAHGATIN